MEFDDSPVGTILNRRDLSKRSFSGGHGGGPGGPPGFPPDDFPPDGIE